MLARGRHACARLGQPAVRVRQGPRTCFSGAPLPRRPGPAGRRPGPAGPAGPRQGVRGRGRGRRGKGGAACRGRGRGRRGKGGAAKKGRRLGHAPAKPRESHCTTRRSWPARCPAPCSPGSGRWTPHPPKPPPRSASGWGERSKGAAKGIPPGRRSPTRCPHHSLPRCRFPACRSSRRRSGGTSAASSWSSSASTGRSSARRARTWHRSRRRSTQRAKSTASSRPRQSCACCAIPGGLRSRARPNRPPPSPGRCRRCQPPAAPGPATAARISPRRPAPPKPPTSPSSIRRRRLPHSPPPLLPRQLGIIVTIVVRSIVRIRPHPARPAAGGLALSSPLGV